MEIVRQKLSQVSEENLSRLVHYMAKDPLPFRKVNYTVPGHNQNSLQELDSWISSQLAGWGYAVEEEHCQVKPFSCDSSKPVHHQYAPPLPDTPLYDVCNTYGRKKGTTHPDEVILLLAHKDSQSWIDSPGAYDNAVGTAAVLELARVLADYPSQRSLWFMFCCEEHTPWTSATAAARCRERNDNLVAVINLDALGGKSDADIAAGRKTNVTLYTHPDGRELADLMQAVNSHYGIGLEQSVYERQHPGDDDGSFIKAGYTRVIANIGSYPYADEEYHLPGDTAERVDFANLCLATRATLAAVLHLDQAKPVC